MCGKTLIRSQTWLTMLTMLKLTKFYFLLSLLVAHFGAIPAAAALDDLLRVDPVFLDLEPVRSRIERQFKDMDNEEAGDSSVAMSLVDALQRWADALEAQASLTMTIRILKN